MSEAPSGETPPQPPAGDGAAPQPPAGSGTTPQPPAPDSTALLAVAALGVVFGDIGTSPLYALRECFAGSAALPVTSANVLGIVSVLLWTLALTVSIKYIVFVLRADNRGQGGILALVTLLTGTLRTPGKKAYKLLVLLGIAGAALLFGDGVLTPAITVLGAVEGLTEATPVFTPYIVPISVVILVLLFLIQSRGTVRVGTLFGPVVLVWFVAIGVLGVRAILMEPAILAALNPLHAIRFFINEGGHSFAVLGSVFLAVTGSEMLYADLGHFGRKPIRLVWFAIVFPSLILNYVGQGAFLLTAPPSAENLFYLIVPDGFLYPMIGLATLAAIIASQAVISGVFSLASQSVQLGFLPRLQVRHTSMRRIGQVYVPFANWCLMAGVIALIVIFRHSSNLAGAYGIAISTDMLITTVLIIIAARVKWSISWLCIVPPAAVFLCIDSAFFGSNVLKLTSGGWIVLVIAGAAFMLIKTWIDGRAVLRRQLVSAALDIESFVRDIKQHVPVRVPGTAVFLAGNPDGVPTALIHNLKHNKVLHEHTVVLSVRTEEIPAVAREHRVVADSLGAGIYRILASYGFTETPDIPALLAGVDIPGLRFDPMHTTFFLGRESLVVADRTHMARWRKSLFKVMAQNALNPTSFFQLPANRVVELGTRTEL